MNLLRLNEKVKKIMSVCLSIALIGALPLDSTYAAEGMNLEAAGEKQQEELNGSITKSITGIDFSNYQFVSDTEKTKKLDNTFLGTIGVEAGKKEAEIALTEEGKSVLRLKALAAGQKVNTYIGGLKLTERFGIECRVRFGDTTSERELFTMKGLTVDDSFSWPAPLLFGADGKIKDAQKTVVGDYKANNWYTVKADIDTQKQEYRVWIHDDTNQTQDIFVKASLNVNGNWNGCLNSYMMSQKAGSNPATSMMEAAYFNAGAIQEELNGYITDNITSLNFSDYKFVNETAALKTVDQGFVGTIGTEEGKKEAVIMKDSQGVGVLRLKSLAAGVKINAYKGGLKIKDRFGIECRVKFGDNASERELFTMKGLTENGSHSWPAPLVFGNDGKIRDSSKTVAGTYQGDVWYTVKAEIDTANQEYKVWISDELPETEDLFIHASLNVGKGNWYGCQYSYMMSQKAGNQLATSYVDFAYFKAGKIQPGVKDILVSDMEMQEGEGVILVPAVEPADAYCGNIQYTSADSDVVKVFENGLLAVGEGKTRITVTEPLSGQSKNFQVTVGKPVTIGELKRLEESVLSISLWSGNRVQIEYSEEQIRTMINNTYKQEPEYFKNMEDSQFIKLVDDDIRSLSTPAQLKNNEYEQLSRYMVLMYHVTGDWEYARKAAMILFCQASYYPHLLLDKDAQIVFGENVIYSFGYLIDAVNKENGKTLWQDIAPAGFTGTQVERTIAEMYLKPMGHRGMDAILKRRLGNLDVYASRASGVISGITDDPILMRKVIMSYDSLLSAEHYYFDGLWEEGTLSYGGQVSNNIIDGLTVVAAYTDPESYTDPADPQKYGLNEKVMGIHLNQTDLTFRWPLLSLTKDMPGYMVYPDGSPIGVNDTHYKKNTDMLPIQEKYLNNIELPGFGYYGLVQGNTDNAVHAGLLYQSKQGFFGGSHEHINVLSMTLWGAGAELLPDVGYVTAGNYADGGGKLRYPSMRPIFANMPWIIRADGANEVSNLGWFKPRLLAYDDGQKNGGLVTLVEASDVGADSMQADVNQRLLMNVALDESHSYVFDLSRMKGGDAHDIFQRGTELEFMTSSFDGATFTDTGKSSLNQADSYSAYGSLATIKDMEYLYNPQEADGSNDFSFVWNGEETGSRITTYMNGVPGSQMFLSSIPTPRRINSKPDEKVYTAPHLTRHRGNVSQEELTKYGAVYETAKAGEADILQDVEWLQPDGFDQMGILGKITSAKYIDYIYISDDTNVRSYDGITFSGKIALVRIDKETGESVYNYIYGQGAAGDVSGNDAQIFDVTGLTTAPDFVLNPSEESEGNTITVIGTVLNAEGYIGRRAQLVFGDGSGYGLKIKSIEENNGSTVLTTEEYVPAELTQDGVVLKFFPLGQKIAGGVKLILEDSIGVINTKIPVTGVVLDRHEIELAPGQVFVLSAAVLPEDAADQEVTWETSDEKTAVVENGVVTTVSAGDAVITVTTKDGGFTDTCAVAVREEGPETVPVAGVDLDRQERTLKVGEEFTLTATVSPGDASTQAVEWSSSDDSVAKVSRGKVKALKEGVADITVTTLDGGFTAQCQVKVLKEEVPLPPAQEENTSSEGGTPYREPEADWAGIRSRLDEALSQLKGTAGGKEQVLNLITGNKTIVPADVLKKIQGQPLVMAFHTGSKLTFSLDGRQLKDKNLSGLDLSVNQGDALLPKEAVGNKTKDALCSRQFVLTHEGALGTNINVHLDMGKVYAGKYASLYYYNKALGKLDYYGSFQVTENGQAMFGLTQGGGYLVECTQDKVKDTLNSAK